MMMKNENIDDLVSNVEERLKISNIVKKLLQLEKELSVPGAQISDDDRIGRIMNEIEKENF
jgi:hypothetical protein